MARDLRELQEETQKRIDNGIRPIEEALDRDIDKGWDRGERTFSYRLHTPLSEAEVAELKRRYAKSGWKVHVAQPGGDQREGSWPGAVVLKA